MGRFVIFYQGLMCIFSLLSKVKTRRLYVCENCIILKIHVSRNKKKKQAQIIDGHRVLVISLASNLTSYNAAHYERPKKMYDESKYWMRRYRKRYASTYKLSGSISGRKPGLPLPPPPPPSVDVYLPEALAVSALQHCRRSR